MKSKISKKVAALGLSAAVLAGGIGAALGVYVADDSVQVGNLQAQVAAVKESLALEQARVSELVEELESIEPVVETVVEEVEVEKIVEVDNQNLDAVLQHIYNNEGDVSLVVEGLKDSELDQVVDRIIFLNDVEALALSEVRAELKELLHREYVGDVRLYRDEISRVRISDKAGEVEISGVGFRYNDAIAKVSGTFEQDSVKYEFVVEVEIRDGKVKETELISVSEQ